MAKRTRKSNSRILKETDTHVFIEVECITIPEFCTFNGLHYDMDSYDEAFNVIIENKKGILTIVGSKENDIATSNSKIDPKYACGLCTGLNSNGYVIAIKKDSIWLPAIRNAIRRNNLFASNRFTGKKQIFSEGLKIKVEKIIAIELILEDNLYKSVKIKGEKNYVKK